MGSNVKPDIGGAVSDAFGFAIDDGIRDAVYFYMSNRTPEDAVDVPSAVFQEVSCFVYKVTDP